LSSPSGTSPSSLWQFISPPDTASAASNSACIFAASVSSSVLSISAAPEMAVQTVCAPAVMGEVALSIVRPF
jgi:hypothetical protein